MEQHHRRRGLVWPAILITAGIVFLLNNLGVLSWGVWTTLLSLWPVLLIAIGLEILIGRRSIWGSALVALLVVVVFVGAAWLDVPARLGGTAISGPQDRQLIQQSLDGATKAVVDIDFSVGELRIDALAEGSWLVDGTIDVLPRERLTQNFRKDGDIAHFDLDSSGSFGLGFTDIRLNDHVWDLGLTREIPLDLRVKAGVGKSELDLSRLNLSHLEVKNGVGEVTVTLPRSGRFSVEIGGGIGEIEILLPRGMEARVRGKVGLGNLDVRGQFTQRDNTYETRGFASATDRVEIDLTGGIGRVSVVQQSE